MGGRCDAALTVRTGCGWVRFMECSMFLNRKRFSLMLKGTHYKTYIMTAFMYGSDI